MICHDDAHKNNYDLITVGDVKKGKSKPSKNARGRRNSRRPLDSDPRPEAESSPLAWPRLEESTEEIVDMKLQISSVDESIGLDSKGKLSPAKGSETTRQHKKTIEDAVRKNTTPNLEPKIIEVNSRLVIGNCPEEQSQQDRLQYNTNFIKNKSSQWNASTRPSDKSRFSKHIDGKSIGTLCPTKKIQLDNDNTKPVSRDPTLVHSVGLIRSSTDSKPAQGSTDQNSPKAPGQVFARKDNVDFQNLRESVDGPSQIIRQFERKSPERIRIEIRARSIS